MAGSGGGSVSGMAIPGLWMSFAGNICQVRRGDQRKPGEQKGFGTIPSLLMKIPSKERG
jgi:hypothetical protein